MSSQCKPVTVEYKCMPWQAPSGGANCDKCNLNTELKPCSKYRCESLGQACELVNEGTGSELCISKQDDAKAPIISPWQGILSANFTYTNVSSNGFSVIRSDMSCIESFTPVTFGINTDEAAQCKLDLSHKATFEDMENYFGESNLYLYNHSMGFSMPSVDLIKYCANNTNLTEADILKQTSHTKMYTRCQDVFGNYNVNEYAIDFCVKPGPDTTAPAIIKTEPAQESILAYNTTTADVSIYTNEPATCKWGKENKNYNSLENSFVCESACNVGLFGYKCSANLT